MPFAPALRAAPALPAPPGDPTLRARGLLAAWMARGGAVLGLPLERRAGGHARTLLSDEGGISVWAMTWGAGAATPVHDHHCACCFGVVSGALVERRFAAVGAGAARCTSEAVRGAGFAACLVPTGPNIHQMINLSGAEAVSIHVYGFDPRVRANSIEREYRAVAAH